MISRIRRSLLKPRAAPHHFFAQFLRDLLFQQVHGGIFAKGVVANCGGGLATSSGKTLVSVNGKKITLDPEGLFTSDLARRVGLTPR